MGEIKDPGFACHSLFGKIQIQICNKEEEVDDRKRKIENRKRMRALQKQGSVQWQAAISGYTSSSRSGAGSHSLLPPYDSDVYFPKRSRMPSASLSFFFFFPLSPNNYQRS